VRWPRSRAGERGSGSVLAVGLAGAIVCLAAVVVPLYGVLAVRSTVAGAADAAALAAADARIGLVSGYPCVRAAEVAAANGAVMTQCRVDGLVATVTVQRDFAGFSIEQRASAGPPN
jgi:secretion/DNA translocation related TadE-like protein